MRIGKLNAVILDVAEHLCLSKMKYLRISFKWKGYLYSSISSRTHSIAGLCFLRSYSI